MPTVIDANGSREVSEKELEVIRAEANAWFWAFWKTLEWRPIAEYDRVAAPDVIVRGDEDGDCWDFAYWGAREQRSGAPARRRDSTPAWRHRQDWQEGDVLNFELGLFATVSEEWATALSAD